MNNVVTKVRPHHSARFLHPAYLHVDVFSCSNMPSEDNMVVVMTVMASMFSRWRCKLLSAESDSANT